MFEVLMALKTNDLDLPLMQLIFYSKRNIKYE